MANFILKRLASTIAIVIALVAILFFLQHLSHIDPAHAILGANASQAAVAVERHKLGLDRPIIDQFFTYLNGLLHGNLGTSYRTSQPVLSNLHQFFPATLELALYALLTTVVLGGLFGIATAMRWPGSGVLRFVMMVGSSTPTFLIGVLGLVWFYKDLGWIPAGGRTDVSGAPTGPTGLLTIDGVLHGQPVVLVNAWWHLLLPVFCIALIPAVSVGRVLRSSLLTTLEADHIRTARANGLSESRIVFKHALRNAAGPALAMLGLQVGLMFAGVAVIEEIVSWPGIGYYTDQSIAVSDFPAILGVTLLLGIAYVVLNFIVDVLQFVADPRIQRN
jgi:peptide/nickel transport system permease protein